MDASTAAQVLPGGVLEIRTHARKGRSLYTTRIVKGGEAVIDEGPILLVVAPEMTQWACLACLRAVGPQDRIECSRCHQACFCSSSCQLAAQGTLWLHSSALCSAYARLAALGLPNEDQAQLRLLLHVLALRHAGHPEAGGRFAALCSLVGEATEAERATAARLAPALTEALRDIDGAGSLPIDMEELATLLRKEQLNSYGVLATKNQQQQQQQVAAKAGPQSGCKEASGEGCSSSAGGRGIGHCGSDVAVSSSSGSGCRTGCGGAQGSVELRRGEREEGERCLRGSAIYAQASLINHECLPNVARFDFFDSDRPDRTHITFRALHDLPAGTELAQSYVPLHWSLAERQAQCREVYGFSCTCPRCQTESRWSDGDREEDEEDEGEEEEEGEDSGWETDSGNEDMEADAVTAAEATGEAVTTATAQQGSGSEALGRGSGGGGEAEEVEMQDVQSIIHAPPGEEGPLEPMYLRLFLLKYMCAASGCFGTAAPPRPGSTRLECNVCGRTRSEREFLRELDKWQQQHEQQQQQGQWRQQQQQQQGPQQLQHRSLPPPPPQQQRQ